MDWNVPEGLVDRSIRLVSDVKYQTWRKKHAVIFRSVYLR